MELRSEPRFPVSAPVKLIPLDMERNEIPSLLVDVSANGLRAVIDAPLPPGETVLVELEDHVIIAESRHSEERGDKHCVGLRRVHEMMKAALPESWTERLMAILDRLPEYSEKGESLDYLRETIAHLVRKPEPAAAPAPEPEYLEPAAEQRAAGPGPVAAYTPVVEEEKPRRNWKVPMAVAAGLLITAGIVSAVLLARSRALSPAPVVIETAMAPSVVVAPASPAPASAPAVETAPKTVATVAVRPASLKPVAVAASARPGTHHAQIRVTTASWISASADSVPLFAKLLQAGETRDIAFTNLSYIHSGNASGIELTLDGKPLGPLGPGRALRLLKLDPAGMHIVPWRDTDPVEP